MPLVAPSHIVTFADRQESDTAAEWTRINPVLGAGVRGLERDTGKMKVGDGTKTWRQLLYVSTGGTSDLQAQIDELSTLITQHISRTITHGTGTPIAEQADLPVGETVDIANGVDSGSVTGLALSFIPSQVVCTMRKPSGGLNINISVVDGSITADGFDYTLDGVTDSADYKFDALMMP